MYKRQQVHLPLSRAAESHALLQQLPARAGTALAGFVDILHGLRRDAARMPADALVRALAERSGLLAALRAQCKTDSLFALRKGNLDELAGWFEGGKGAGIAELAAQLALVSRNDKDEGGNQVRLMSLHAAKGLEFRFVFIVGLEDGTVPHEASLDEGRLEEERRLLYVGITRAKERLWLSHARRASRWGSTVRLSPSRFLDELPAAELWRDGEDPAADAARKAERRSAGFVDIRALLDD